MIQQEMYQVIGSDKKEKGPMRHAMIATNPLLPPDYFAPKGLDPFVADMNKDLEYSLLKCPGKYTVQVATFRAGAGQAGGNRRGSKRQAEGQRRPGRGGEQSHHARQGACG